jgi:hypothetical protein
MKHMKKNIVLAVLGACFGVQVCAAGSLWTPGTGVPGGDFYAVAYGQNLYVAVGNSGGLITSSDGIAWSTPASTDYVPTANNLNAVAYGNGTFVAVGDNGWTVYSSDGVHWTSISSGVTVNDLAGIAYADSEFVAVGANGTIVASPTGATWVAAGYAGGASDTSDDLSSVTYGNGKFVAVGSDGNTTFISTDAASWSQGGNGLTISDMTGVTFGSGQFVLVDNGGDIANSTDGLNWAMQASVATGLNGIAYGNGFFATVGYGGAIYLSSGSNFWFANDSGQANNLYGIGFGGGLFVAPGQAGTVLSSSLTETSANPTEQNWALASYAPGTADTSDSLACVAYGNGIYVALGSDGDTAFTSANGITWTQGGNGLTYSDITGVTFGNGQFVLVDNGGDIATSPDGRNWTPQTGTGTGLNDVATFGGTYVAVGDVLTTDGVVFTSPLAIRWTQVDPGVAENLYGITSAPRTPEFVAVGQQAVIITSTDLGATWVDQTNITANNLYDLHGVTYGGGQFVAVGASGMLLTSTDGVNWIQPNYLTTGNDLNAVAYGDGLFVAVGDNGWTIISGDAINWTSVGSPTINNLDAVTYGNNGFVAVGDNGAILNLIIPTMNPAVLPNGTVQVTVNGGVSQSVKIIYSTDLVHWTFLTTVSLNGFGVGQFTDPATATAHFYRAQAVGP